jgi:pilus assembly protein Flp/PilA
MIKKLTQFFKDEDGATAVEYGLMVALIAAVVIAGATILGTETNTTFNKVAGKVTDAHTSVP